MSLKTWKEIYYPKPPSKRMTKKAAIEHSLQKWIGLLPKNLEKHGLEKMYRCIQEIDNNTEGLFIDDESCALCVKYLVDNPVNDECEKCPLRKSLGEPCDIQFGIYHTWYKNGDPKQMIKALKALLEDK